MKTNRVFCQTLLFGLACFCVPASIGVDVRAQEITMQAPTLAFKPTPDVRDVKSIEPSGVEPIGDGKYLLVADDNASALLVVEAQTAEVVNTLPIPGYPVESRPDWEAMAKDSQGKYYLIASHKSSGNYHLLCFHLDGENGNTPGKYAIVLEAAQPNVKIWFDGIRKTLKGTVPEIEGLAVWENEGRKELVFGVRQKGQETILVYHGAIINGEIPTVEAFFKFEAPPRMEDTTKIGWHISSIEHTAEWGGGFLIVTSSEEGPKFYGSKIWFVSKGDLKKPQPSSPKPLSSAETFIDVTPLKGDVFEKTMKAEGLAVLRSNDAKLSVVIVFDNDYPETTQPAALSFADLSKPKK